MKSDNLIDAIGMIDDDIIADAGNMTRIRHRRSGRMITAAAAAILIAASLPTATAFGSDSAYRLFSMVMPETAQMLRPVNMSCISQGILMEVESAGIVNGEARAYIGLKDTTGNRINGSVDPYDSAGFDLPYDGWGNVTFDRFDEDTGTAWLLVTTGLNDGSVRPGKVTFRMNQMLLNKKKTEGIIDGADLSDIPENVPVTTDVKLRGNISYTNCLSGTAESSEPVYLLPSQKPIAEPADGVQLTAIGWVNGRLHIQIHYDDLFNTDNHGYVELRSRNGQSITDAGNVYYSTFWDDKYDQSRLYECGCGSYDEYVFDVSPEEIADCQLWGEFVTCNDHVRGDWSVTFRIEE